MSVHDLSEPTKRAIDVAAFLLAGVSAVSLAQAALFMSLLAALISVILGCIRIYDRLRYGRRPND